MKRRSPPPRAPLPAVSLLKEALRLDGAGKLRWRVRPAEQRSAVDFARQFPGKLAGSLDERGRLRISVTFGTQAYFFTADKAGHDIRTGRWPRAKPK